MEGEKIGKYDAIIHTKIAINKYFNQFSHCLSQINIINTVIIDNIKEEDANFTFLEVNMPCQLSTE